MQQDQIIHVLRTNQERVLRTKDARVKAIILSLAEAGMSILTRQHISVMEDHKTLDVSDEYMLAKRRTWLERLGMGDSMNAWQPVVGS